jgi:molybdopterin molybdotransferase
MISFRKARNIILKSFSRRTATKVSLDFAFMRVLAQDVIARTGSPEFDRATMDGFAVRSSDELTLECIEMIPAGCAPKKALRRGECAKVATGAMLPQGADSVVMKEEARLLSGNRVLISQRPRCSDNIARRAQDFKKGDTILKKGDLLNAPKIGLLSSQGIKYVWVYRPPSVSILSTGDEVVEPGENKKRWQIWNASGSMLKFALMRWQVAPDYLGIVRDDPKQALKKIRQGLKSDILIITGAVSVGDFDFVPAVLKRSGASVKFHKVAIKPGKPLLFAVKGDHFIFGLPGNPVSSLVSFLLFVAPLINNMLGFKTEVFLEKGFLAKGVYNRSGRLSLLPGRLARKKGSIFIRPIDYSGSADLRAISAADVLFMVDKNRSLQKGSTVQFFRLSA